MTAKEMFEKLGYKENNDRETCLRYTIYFIHHLHIRNVSKNIMIQE